jgi:DNA invertase Pin-like site-specific DNA recombinase
MAAMTRIGYARVSTRDQKEDSQVDELTAAGCTKVYVDKCTGKHAKRPQLDRCLASLRAGDVLVITRLSRAMRSLKHLLELAEVLRDRGVDLVVLKQDIDTTTPTGRLVFHIMAAFDEFQRELIVEGTHEGLAAAKARGKTGGRRPALSREQKRLARRLRGEGKNVVTIARLLGVSRPTIYRALDEALPEEQADTSSLPVTALVAV